MALALAFVSAARGAGAQRADPASEPTVERVEVEDVLRPRPGRARLEVRAEGGASVAVGLAAQPPVRADLSVRFGAERAPVLCRTPCAMHLRPGPQRLVGDADTPYVWSSDVALSPEGARYLLRPHRVGLSALGGAMFIVGCLGSVLGPGVIIVNLVVGDPQVRGWSVLGGSIAGALGAGLVVGGWFTVQAGAPRLRLQARPFVGADGLGVTGVF